jgi:hypothetical protein
MKKIKYLFFEISVLSPLQWRLAEIGETMRIIPHCFRTGFARTHCRYFQDELDKSTFQVPEVIAYSTPIPRARAPS